MHTSVVVFGNTIPFLASGSGSLQKYTNQRWSLPHFVAKNNYTAYSSIFSFLTIFWPSRRECGLHDYNQFVRVQFYRRDWQGSCASREHDAVHLAHFTSRMLRSNVRRLCLGCRIWQSQLNPQLVEGGLFGKQGLATLPALNLHRQVRFSALMLSMDRNSDRSMRCELLVHNRLWIGVATTDILD
jgi:hypothetical protein